MWPVLVGYFSMCCGALRMRLPCRCEFTGIDLRHLPHCCWIDVALRSLLMELVSGRGTHWLLTLVSCLLWGCCRYHLPLAAPLWIEPCTRPPLIRLFWCVSRLWPAVGGWPGLFIPIGKCVSMHFQRCFSIFSSCIGIAVLVFVSNGSSFFHCDSCSAYNSIALTVPSVLCLSDVRQHQT